MTDARGRKRHTWRPRTRITGVVRELDHVAIRVWLRMRELGITQLELAGRLGVSRPRVSAMLSRPAFTESFLGRLLLALELGPDAWSEPLELQEPITAEEARKILEKEAKKRLKNL